MDSENKKSQIKNSRIIGVCVGLILLSFLLIFGSISYYRKQILQSTQLMDNYDNESYKKHYAMITSDSKSLFWQNVYMGARDRAAELGAYLELLGTSLDVEYEETELLQIAIKSQVDGIVVEASDDEQMVSLIDQATGAGIPVVTVLGDSHGSGRQSFVGISSYNAGHEYGSRICEILTSAKPEKEEYQIIVLLDEEGRAAGQNLVYSGIQDTIETEYEGDAHIEMKTSLISKRTAFAAEEVVRDIFLSEEQLPDIMVCLDEMYTACAYQAAIDYNKVGKIAILGYYQSDTIFGGIAGNVIDSTLTIDATQMGMDCIDALAEYSRTGYVSDYIAVDTVLIGADNIAAYIGGEMNEEQASPAQPDDTK